MSKVVILVNCPSSVGSAPVTWLVSVIGDTANHGVGYNIELQSANPVIGATAKHIILTKIQISETGQSSQLNWDRPVELVGICHFRVTSHHGVG
jgi:hypothetical protein